MQYIIWAYIYKRKIHWRRDRPPTPVFSGFPCGLAGKEAACNAGDLGINPGLGRSSEEGKGYLFQYSGLENSMDCIVHGVTKSQTRLNNFRFHRDEQYELHTNITYIFIWNTLHQISQDPSDILAYSRAHDVEKNIHVEGREEDFLPAPILSTGKCQFPKL